MGDAANDEHEFHARGEGPADGVDAVDGVDDPAGHAGFDETETAYELFARGRGLLDAGHPHAAATLLARAKRLEPEKASIREALGRALFMSGRMSRARREFAKTVAIDPVNDYAHFALALSCARTGQMFRAVAHLKLAIAMRPDIEEYRRALARIAMPRPVQNPGA